MAGRSKWLIGTGLALLAIGTSFVVGRTSAYWTPRAESRYPSAPSRNSASIERVDRRPSSADTGVRLRDDQLFRQELRQLLQEELRGFSRAEEGRIREPAPAGEPQSDSSGERAMDDEGLAAYDRGQALVRDALGSRVWTPKQAEQMRGILPKLPEERGRELLDQLFSAMSRGEVKSNGPPI